MTSQADRISDSRTLLQFRELTFGYGSDVLLRDANFHMSTPGVVALLGPSGVGKSTFLRALARLNDAQPAFWIRGRVELDGADLLQAPISEARRRVRMVMQKARFYTGSVLDNLVDGYVTPGAVREDLEALAWQMLEPCGLREEFQSVLDEEVLSLSIGTHKRLLVARMMMGPDVQCLLVDEPFRDVAVAEEGAVMELLERIAERILVILVTHNKQEARQLSDVVCFMSGSRMIEVTQAEEFFREPRTEAGREFLHSGSSWVPDDGSGPPLRAPAKALRAPREFHWVQMNLLGGVEQPGLRGDLDGHLDGLQQLGVQVLVTLLEQPFEVRKIESRGIMSVHFPIDDMKVPTLAAAEELCARIAGWTEAGRATVVHCKAGLGRTGTILACVLVHQGLSPVKAIDTVRGVKSGYIQSDEQFAFVGEFAPSRGPRAGGDAAGCPVPATALDSHVFEEQLRLL